MSTITKSIAYDVAVKMSRKKHDLATNLRKELSETVSDLYLKQIPAQVAECFKKNPSYFDTRTSLTIAGNGFNHERIRVSKDLPASSSYVVLSPSDTAAEKLIRLSYKVDEAQKEADELKKEIEMALLALRTFKRVQEQFPEAYSFLPTNSKTGVIVNLESVRNKLKT